MNRSFAHIWKTCGAAVLGGSLLAGAAQADPPRVKILRLPGEGKIEINGDVESGVIVVNGEATPANEEKGIVISGVATAEAQLAPVKLSDFWLGVQAGPLDPVVLAQLKLDHGLAVVHVANDSPAGKAGFKVHDILLQFGDVNLKELPQLVEALDKNKDQEVTVKVLREGKEITLKVTPAKRPEGSAKAELPPLPGGAPPEVEKWFQGLQRGEGRGPVRMFFAHPGTIVAQAQAEAKAFPADLSIAVEKQGDKPAHVKVKQGDKSWDVTQDKIDELPEDIRPFVRQLLNQPNDFNIRVEGGGPGFGVREFHAGPGAENLQKQFAELHRMLDQLQQQVGDQPGGEQLRKEVQELRKQFQERRNERQEKAKPETKPESKTEPNS